MEGNISNNPADSELPADLQVPLTPTPTPRGNSQVGGPPPLVTDFNPPPIVGESKPAPILEPLQPRHRGGGSWLGWLFGGLLILGLVGGTTYFVLTQIGFNRGKIKFTFEPAGVDLVIDQKVKKSSVSDITVTLKAGSHFIQATKEGFLDWEQTFDLQPKETAEVNVVLEAIPNIDAVAEFPVTWPSLVNKDQLLAFFDEATKKLRALNLATKEVVNLFELDLLNLQKVAWSPKGSVVLIKLSNTWRLPNMFDNRRVPGQFIPLGEQPQQGPTLNNGVATWLLDSDRRTNAGIQPVLLNENVREVIFSSDGSQIVYFYEAANGEKSLIRAENPDGGNWVRLATNVDANDPKLQWVNDDRHILLLDDVGKSDKLFDAVSKEFVDVMTDRVAATVVLSSPTGTRIAYVANVTAGPRLAIWNIAEQKVEKVFDNPADKFVWQDEDTLIVSTADRSLGYWGLDGRTKPVKFISAFGELQPQWLWYSRLLQKLFIGEAARIFMVKA